MSGESMAGYRVTQIGFVVDDLDKAIAAYQTSFGWGPWRVYDVVPPLHRNSTLHGNAVTGGTRIAIASAGTVDIELIQPLDGESQHAEWIEKHGPGINHILVRDYDDHGVEKHIDPAVFGLPLIASGNFTDAIQYNYLDGSDSGHAIIIEVVRGSTAEANIEPERVVSGNGLGTR